MNHPKQERRGAPFDGAASRSREHEIEDPRIRGFDLRDQIFVVSIERTTGTTAPTADAEGGAPAPSSSA